MLTDLKAVQNKPDTLAHQDGSQGLSDRALETFGLWETMQVTWP